MKYSAEILALVMGGMPIAAVARELGVSRQHVYDVIKRAGYVAADTRWVPKQ